jgi:glycosyltransferase involved in cell wall biosynthesis
MRYLHVNAAYPPFLGGAEVYTQAISERFVDEGHAVTLVTTNAAEVEYFWNPRKRHLSPGHERLNGVEIIRCRVSHPPLSPWTFYALRRAVTTLARLPLANSQFANHIFRRLAPYMPGVPEIEATLAALPYTFDLVHGVNISLEWPLLAAWRYARQCGLPFIATPFVHVGEYEREDVLINYTMPHQLEALRVADAVIVQTDIEKQALIRCGVKEDRLHRLGMGVDINELRGGNAERFRERYDLSYPIVTFLGVVTYDKGSFHLVRAIERLWLQGQDVHLVVAGPQVDEFIQFYNRLPSATREKILLLGPVLGQDKQDLLAATDVFALPSRIDSFGIVYLEAWSYAKPVIGARAGGVLDVIEDGKDGLLVEFGDVDGIATAIEDLLTSPAQARAMGLQGQNKVEAQYTWDRIHNRLRTIYERLAD